MSRRRLLAFCGAAIAVFAIAQLGSHLVQVHLGLHEPYVINSWLHLTYIRNTGVIFGMLPGKSLAFAMGGAVIVTIGCLLMLRSVTALYQAVCLGFIVGAAASNICDRLLYGAVIDFIDVQGIPGWHYIFNTADVMIHVGAWPLALGAMFADKDEK